MAKLKISVPHHQSRFEALSRIKNLLTEVKREYGDDIRDLHESWSEEGGSFSFKVRGMEVGGTLTVMDREVILDGNIPLVVVPFRGRIAEIVTRRANTLLA